MLSFKDMLKPLTLDGVKATIISTASQLGLKTENWAEGGFTRTLVALFGQLYLTMSNGVIPVLAGSAALDTCEDEWLTALAFSMFRVTRIEATYASAAAALKLTNTGGGVYTFEPGDIVMAHVSSGKTYRNTSGGTLNAGAGQTLLLDLEAEEPGSESNAAVGAITTMVTTFLGVTATNVLALTGLDEESDDAIRARCRNSLAALSPGGTRKAYEFAATSAVDENGVSLGVTRVLVMPAVGDGTVDIYIAGASGALGGAAVAAVQTEFDDKVTPYGFEATALDCVNHVITCPATVWIPQSLGLTDAEAQTAINDAITAYVQSIPIGGTVLPPATGKVYWRKLLGVIEGSIAGAIAQLDTEADVAIATGEVPTYGGSGADFTIVQVAT